MMKKQIDYALEVSHLSELLIMYDSGILVDDSNGEDIKTINDKLLLMQSKLAEQQERDIARENRPIIYTIVRFLLWIRRVLGINKNK